MAFPVLPSAGELTSVPVTKQTCQSLTEVIDVISQLLINTPRSQMSLIISSLEVSRPEAVCASINITVLSLKEKI